MAYEAVVLLGRKGGWDGLIPKKVGKTKVKDGVVDDGDQVVNVVEEEEKERIAKPAKRVKASGRRKKTEVDVDGRAEPGVMEDEEVKAEIKGKKRGKAAASGGRKRNVAGQEIGEGEEAGGTIAVERAEGERQETKAVVKKGTPRKPRAGKAADPPHIGERRSARTKR